MFTPTGKNTMLTALPSLFASLHTGFPGNTGASEVTGGTPAYARIATTFGSAAGGSRSMSSTPAFNVPASTIVWVGFWDALTAGNFIAYSPNGGTPKEFVTDTTNNNVRLPAHGYAANTQIVFYNGTVPGGLSAGTIYFVVNPTTDTFQVSATSGGAAITINANSSQDSYVSTITPVVYSAQGTHTLTAGTLDLNR